jgi:bacterioferritin (cytochrome b1)
MRAAGKAHLTSLETRLHLIETVGLENYAAQQMQPG